MGSKVFKTSVDYRVNTRYCSEENYEEFKNVIMKSENLIFIKTEVKINSIRGEF